MATRQDVEAAIETINDNGNNTAKEVRDVLTSLLDYTENEDMPAIPDMLEHFEANNKKKPTRFGNIARLGYSFRGFKKFSVNFTFALGINKAFDGALKFPLENGLGPILKEIIAVNNPSFVVPISGRITQRGTTHINTNATIFADMVTIGVEGNTLILIFANPKRLVRGSKVFTSIQLHTPAFFKD